MEEFKGDKRTKEYKDWKAQFEAKQETKSKGLGDTIDKITTATGIKKAVEFLTPEGEDCGCDERKSLLNKLVKYKVVNCLEEDEFNYLSGFMAKKEERITAKVQIEILKIYNRVFSKNQQKTNCAPCLRTIIKQLEILLKNS